MHRIELMPPVVERQSVLFRWRVEPQTPLYRQTSFTMTFPASVDLSRIPGRLWWDVLIMCLHPHWLLLRPCEIHVPIRLGEREREFWLRLLENGAHTLAAYNPARASFESVGIALTYGDRDLARRRIAGFGFATSFSSGKDSLLQAGLLCELTERPLLVTTTSPLPPLADHQTLRRKEVLAAIQARRKIRFVEVISDFRSSWDNNFAGHLGFPLAVNELTDTFLYLSSLLAAGAALGATRLFVASEAEVQVNAVIDGKIVQHSHFMYSAATQRTLSELFGTYGVRIGSLIWPLYSMQVQQLLWARYPDLSDLQYSCWRVQPGQATCSECGQCFRIAMIALASGENPERMGIDLRKVLAYAPDWETRGRDRPASSPLPQDGEARRVDLRVNEAVARLSLPHLARVLSQGDIRRMPSRKMFRALRDIHRLRRRARRLPRLPPPGVREAFFDWLDPDLRERLISIYTSHFSREPRKEHLEIFERSCALSLHATSALD
jgi:hypothetical protein